MLTTFFISLIYLLISFIIASTCIFMLGAIWPKFVISRFSSVLQIIGTIAILIWIVGH